MENETIRRWAGRAAMAGVLVFALGASACPDNSDTRPRTDDGTASGTIRIEPSGATLIEGETSVVLRAVDSDGTVVWTVSDEDLGTVAPTSGRKVVYTRAGTANGINIVRATDQARNRATANIVQTDDPEVVPGDFTVTPGNTVLTGLLATLELTASGGNPPYSWSVEDTSQGTIEPFGSPDRERALYRSITIPGFNRIRVRDSAGRTATALVTQAP